MSFSNFEKKVKLFTLLKYDDKYSIIAAYCQASALLRVIDSKTNEKSKTFGGKWNTGTDMCQQVAAYSVKSVNISTHIFMDMLAPSAFEIVRTFDLNV